MGEGRSNGEVAAILRVSSLLTAGCPRGHFYRRVIQKASRPLLGGQKRPDFALQRFIASRCVPQKRITLLGRTLQH
jgi:hypothetical protein